MLAFLYAGLYVQRVSGRAEYTEWFRSLRTGITEVRGDEIANFCPDSLALVNFGSAQDIAVQA